MKFTNLFTLIPVLFFAQVVSAEDCDRLIQEADSTDRDLAVLTYCGCAISEPLQRVEDSSNSWFSPAVTDVGVMLPGNGEDGVLSAMVLSSDAVHQVDFFRFNSETLDRVASVPYFFSETSQQAITPLPKRGAPRVSALDFGARSLSPLGPAKRLETSSTLKQEVGARLSKLLLTNDAEVGRTVLDPYFPIPNGSVEELTQLVVTLESQRESARERAAIQLRLLNERLKELTSPQVTYSLVKGPKGHSAMTIHQGIAGRSSDAGTVDPQTEALLRSANSSARQAQRASQEYVSAHTRLKQIKVGASISSCIKGLSSLSTDWGGFNARVKSLVAEASRIAPISNRSSSPQKPIGAKPSRPKKR
jgi:hypothetical protein